MFRRVYWFFSYLGVMTLSASLILGFQHDAEAPLSNVWYDIGLYAVFYVIHILMTAPVIKDVLFGKPEGTLFERQIYITVSIVTWLAVFFLHKPVPGPAFDPPQWVQLLGLCMMLLSFFSFFEFATFDVLGRLLGMPEAELSHSIGAETPLMIEGPYAKVRHPMYRAAFFLTLSSLVVHPHTGQLLFAAMIAASFIGFIPIEEAQLIRARGDEYLEYKRRTPYRVFHGIW